MIEDNLKLIKNIYEKIEDSIYNRKFSYGEF